MDWIGCADDPYDAGAAAKRDRLFDRDDMGKEKRAPLCSASGTIRK